MKDSVKSASVCAYEEFAALYDQLMSDVDYGAWAGYVHGLLMGFLPETLSGQPFVVDCACGTGEIALRLAQAGCRTVGVDCSADMLRIAQQKAMAKGLRIPFVHGDMRSFSIHKPADAVLACCDGVNYLTSLEDAGYFFAAANQALKPGGLLLFDISSAHKLTVVLDDRCFGESEKGYAYLWQNCFDPESQLLEMDLTFFVQDGPHYRRFEETHIQRAHTETELDDQLAQHGFTVCAKYDAFTRDPPREDSERIQWVARKNEHQ